MGLAVLALLGVLMVGLNGLARAERRRPERRSVRQLPPASPPPLPEPEPEPLGVEPLSEPAPSATLFNVEAEPVDRSSEDTSRRRRSGISPDALEELLDL